jgi:Domain of unknown function (DUF4185)
MRRTTFTILALLPALASAQEPTWFPGTTVKICQLTGDFDVARKLPTLSRTKTRFGVEGTDLGSSFEHDGKLWFLFGDTRGRSGDRDFLASTTAILPEEVNLDVRTDPKHVFLPLELPGFRLGAFEVPTCGTSTQGRMLVLFTTDHTKERTMGRSVLGASDDDGKKFEALGELSRKHFINAAMAKVGGRDAPGLPYSNGILVFGTGDYRKSDVRLMVLDASNAVALQTKKYFTGAREGVSHWADDEDAAVKLLDHAVVGEISVAWIPPLSRWVMLYNSSSPRGIVMRTAVRPWGPWSAPQVIFEPWRDGGYPQFMHVSSQHGRMDRLSDAGRDADWGGEYGPFLIPRFVTGDEKRCTLVFTMSTWNPYQVVIMRADVGRAAESRPTKTTRTLPGSAGWTVSPGMLKTFEHGGKPAVTTFAEKGDETTGVASLRLTATRGGSVSFTIHGGHAEVLLLHQKGDLPGRLNPASFYQAVKAGAAGRVVEAVSGPDSNDGGVPIKWSLDRFAGEDVTILIVDHLAEPWGFVSLSEVEIVSSA